MRYSSRADLSPWFCSCCGSMIGPRLETALPAGLKPPPCEQPAGQDPDGRSVHLLLTRLARILNSEVELYQQPDGKGQPLRAIASWGLGRLNEQIARSHEGGVVGHALGAKRVALGPLSPSRYGLARGAPHDGVGVPARGFATIDLDADSWR